MGAFGILDIVALAKQGYKPADVKELIALANSAEDGKADEEPPAGSGNDVPPAGEPEKETEPEAGEDAIDYKAKYEEAQKALAEAQKQNRSADHQPDQGNPEDDLKELFATFY